MAAGAELEVAIVHTVDRCLEHGARIRRALSTVRHGPEEIEERFLRLEILLSRTDAQLDLVRRVADIMDESHRELHIQALEVLLAKLKIAHRKLDKVVAVREHGSGEASGGAVDGGGAAFWDLTPRRWRYVRMKEGIDRVIEEIETWQRLADPSWFLLLKSASPRIDEALQQQQTQQRLQPPAAVPNQQQASGSSVAVSGVPQSTMHIRNSTLLLEREKRSTPGAAVENDGIFLPADELNAGTKMPIAYSDFLILRRPGTRRIMILDTVRLSVAASSILPGGHYHNGKNEGADPNYGQHQHYQQQHVNMLSRDIRDLARRLRHDDPLTFRLLACKGVVRETQQTASMLSPSLTFTLVFRIPPGMSDPRSLRELLLLASSSSSTSEGQRRPTLTERFAIAQSLARAVCYVHTLGFVHKDVRPETVVLFRNDGDMSSSYALPPPPAVPPSRSFTGATLVAESSPARQASPAIPPPYPRQQPHQPALVPEADPRPAMAAASREAFLVGFSHLRRDGGATLSRRDGSKDKNRDATSWRRDLYQHPGRQSGNGGNGTTRETDYYVMQHDIYGLGVVLLEVGLWGSFVEYEHDGSKNMIARPGKALYLHSPTSIDRLQWRPPFLMSSPEATKAHLVSLARTRLPQAMGRRYAEVVETCLTCLDPGNIDFGDESEFQDRDGILVAVRYIEKVGYPFHSPPPHLSLTLSASVEAM